MSICSLESIETGDVAVSDVVGGAVAAVAVAAAVVAVLASGTS